MITLIATGHYEKGLCTSNELLKIIDQISPDVIFEEMSPSIFKLLYENKLEDALESRAVKWYLQKNEVDHFPVDLNIDKETENYIRSNYVKITNYLANYSAVYNNKWNQLSTLRKLYGFPYLNSEHCDKLFEQKHLLEAELVEKIKIEDYGKRYQEWVDIIHQRENEMIRNIYHYCAQNTYKSALFLVGVKHRKALIDKVADFEKTNGIHLDWKFDFF